MNDIFTNYIIPSSLLKQLYSRIIDIYKCNYLTVKYNLNKIYVTRSSIYFAKEILCIFHHECKLLSIEKCIRNLTRSHIHWRISCFVTFHYWHFVGGQNNDNLFLRMFMLLKSRSLDTNHFQLFYFLRKDKKLEKICFLWFVFISFKRCRCQRIGLP